MSHPEPKICAHCGNSLRGYGSVNSSYLCHPDVGMDCYRLVTVYGEPMGARKPGGELHCKRTPIPDNPLPFHGLLGSR